MTLAHGPIAGLIGWVQTGADGRDGRRMAADWSARQPALAGFATVGDVVRSAWGDPRRAAVLVAALAAIADTDERAAHAALAIVAPRLQDIATRWARAGVPTADLEEMEADLLAETLAELRGDPSRPVGKIVDAAWARVRAARRRHRRHQAGQQGLDAVHDLAARTEPAAAEVAVRLIFDAVRSGRLSLGAARALYLTAVAGWPTSEAAEQIGCRPDALRARRSRALRALAA